MNSTAFSMLDQGPGPGSYAIRDTFKKHKDSKGFKIAGRYEEPEKLNVPGPGSYKKVSTVLTNAKPMTFSKMERDNAMIVKDQVMTPPAGLYRIKGATSPNDKKGVTICEKRPLKEQSERPHNPGPGTYLAKKENLKPMTGGYIGNSKRGGEPGPAVASATHKKKEASDDFEVERVIGDQRGPPGPGTYKPRPATVQGPKYSMAGKPQDEKPQQVPGPGTYKGDKFMNSVKSKATILIGPGPKSSKKITSQKEVQAGQLQTQIRSSIRPKVRLAQKPQYKKLQYNGMNEGNRRLENQPIEFSSIFIPMCLHQIIIIRFLSFLIPISTLPQDSSTSFCFRNHMRKTRCICYSKCAQLLAYCRRVTYKSNYPK